jgi:hypothetical protein
MPETFSMTAVLAIFCAVFLGQIFLLSVYYPRVIVGRIKYVLEQFPPADYPKLYPAEYSSVSLESRQSRDRVYLGINYAIASVGLLILGLAGWHGFEPAPEGGAEIFVMLYFFLQVIPYIYAEFAGYKHFKTMRKVYDEPKRTAVLEPRGFFDFISPFWLLLAGVLLTGWIWYFTESKMLIGPLDIEYFGTLAAILGVHVLYGFIIYKFMYGKKQDPYRAHSDQMKMIENTIKIHVYSSIMISIFLIYTVAADRTGIEIFDPVMTSFYMQLCAFMGIGFMLRHQKLETMDFEVYREGSSAP